MKRSLLFLLFLAVVLTCLGCGGAASRPMLTAKSGFALEEEKREGGGEKADAPQQPRKIIYTARVELVVEEFDKAEEELNRLVGESKGYIAKSDTRGTPGTPRSGDWTLRIPVAAFTEFVADLAKLGELRQSKTDSDDITERYYDTKAHIKNDQAEEEALRKLMVEKSATGKLEDLLAIRRELRDLRGKIDSQQGQMERWDKDVAMTTITVQIHDRKDYVPTTSPTFGTSIGRTFEGSIDALLSFGRGIVLIVVAVAPWLAVLAVPGVALWWLIRRQIRSGRGHVATVLPADPPPAS